MATRALKFSRSFGAWDERFVLVAAGDVDLDLAVRLAPGALVDARVNTARISPHAQQRAPHVTAHIRANVDLKFEDYQCESFIFS